MNTKHTPGPWKVTEGKDGRAFIHVSDKCDDLTTIAEIQQAPFGGVDTEGLTNACLIASSPELLTELETMVKFCQRLRDSRQEYPVNLEAATALILKTKSQ